MTASVCRPAMTRPMTSSWTPRNEEKPKMVWRISSGSVTAPSKPPQAAKSSRIPAIYCGQGSSFAGRRLALGPGDEAEVRQLQALDRIGPMLVARQVRQNDAHVRRVRPSAHRHPRPVAQRPPLPVLDDEHRMTAGDRQEADVDLSGRNRIGARLVAVHRGAD